MQRKIYLIGVLFIFITSKCFSYTYWEKTEKLGLCTLYEKICCTSGLFSNSVVEFLFNTTMPPIMQQMSQQNVSVNVKCVNIYFSYGRMIQCRYTWYSDLSVGNVWVGECSNIYLYNPEVKQVFYRDGISSSSLHKTFQTYCDMYLGMLD